jgi:hypothetical protein
MRKYHIFLLLILLIGFTACKTPEVGNVPTILATAAATTDPIPTNTPRIETATITAAVLPPTDVPGSSESSTPTLAPDDWKNKPIVPVVSGRMVEVYRAGLAAGRDPTHFSKIGDCQNITTYFLASLDNPKLYRLGDRYASLQVTIDHFSGSWSRQSLAVKPGQNVAAVLSPFWTDPKQCNSGETPVACEVRVFDPSIVIISMEESWSGDIEKYDAYMRRIVEYVLSQNVIPILATRAELPGSKLSINATVAGVAYDYQVPLWNFWAATNPLPSHGLTEDGFHLTQAQDFFDDPASMAAGWPWRNLTALEAIDEVYRAVRTQP